MVDGLFHVHSNLSHDGRLSILALVDLCREIGAGALFLTEHYDDLDPEKMEAFVSTCNAISAEGLCVVSGIEYDFPECSDTHVLAVGLERFVPRRDIRKTLEEIRSNGALIIVAHLSRNGGHIPDEILDIIHGCEVWNTGYDSRYVPNYKILTAFNRIKEKRPNILAFSGSDLHDKNGAKGLVLRFESPVQNVKDVLHCVKNGKFINKGLFFKYHATRRCFGFFTLMMVFFGNILIDTLYLGVLLKKRMWQGRKSNRQ